MKEIWKQTEHFDGALWVSNMGNVKVVLEDKIKILRIHKQPFDNGKRYRLFIFFRKRRFYVSRLVAEAFLQGFGKYVIFKNKDTLDCRAENLLWANTQSEIKAYYLTVYAYGRSFRLNEKASEEEKARVYEEIERIKNNEGFDYYVWEEDLDDFCNAHNIKLPKRLSLLRPAQYAKCVNLKYRHSLFSNLFIKKDLLAYTNCDHFDPLQGGKCTVGYAVYLREYEVKKAFPRFSKSSRKFWMKGITCLIYDYFGELLDKRFEIRKIFNIERHVYDLSLLNRIIDYVIEHAPHLIRNSDTMRNLKQLKNPDYLLSKNRAFKPLHLCPQYDENAYGELKNNY